MSVHLTPVHFQAKWDTSNESLKPFCHETWKKVAFNIISIAIPIIGLVRIIYYLVQSCFKANRLETTSPNLQGLINFKFKQRWSDTGTTPDIVKRNFKPCGLKLKTPDGNEISAIYYKHQNSTVNTPIICYFSESEPSKVTTQLSKFLYSAARRSEQNSAAICDFITFDYRGTGESKGVAWRNDDLVIDGDTVFQYIKTVLKKPNNKIHVLTNSAVGAAVGAKVKYLHPALNGSIISLKGFNLSGIFSKIASWDFAASNYWSRLNGRKMVVYHPYDKIMNQCSLRQSLINQNEGLETKFLQIKDSDFRLSINYPDRLEQNIHTDPLYFFTEAKTNQNSVEHIMDFILQEKISQRAATWNDFWVV